MYASFVPTENINGTLSSIITTLPIMYSYAHVLSFLGMRFPIGVISQVEYQIARPLPKLRIAHQYIVDLGMGFLPITVGIASLNSYHGSLGIAPYCPSRYALRIRLSNRVPNSLSPNTLVKPQKRLPRRTLQRVQRARQELHLLIIRLINTKNL